MKLHTIFKTVPGTYSEDNYGRYIEDLKLMMQRDFTDRKKKLMLILGPFQSKDLDKITYLVNDSFDTEKVQNLATKIFFTCRIKHRCW
jgi:hypothetical protein